MQVGVGYSNTRQGVEAGKEAARAAMTSAQLTRADFVLAFCHGHHDHLAFYLGLRSILGPEVPIVGGSSIGVITQQELSYEGFPVAVAVFQFSEQQCQVSVGHNLFKSPAHVGQQLMQGLQTVPDPRFMLLFYDSIKFAACQGKPPVLNPSQPLLQSIQNHQPYAVPLLGAGLLGSHQFEPTQQFCGHQVNEQSACALLFSGAVTPFYTVMHGCAPLNAAQYTISSIYGQFLYQLDGRPITQVLDELLQNPEWRQQVPISEICLGVNTGPAAEPFSEQNYINRLISGVLPDDEGVILFESDLKEGMQVELMRRDPQTIQRSARENTQALVKQVEQSGLEPVFALYLDCGGRCASQDKSGIEEAAEVQTLLKQHKIPLLGIYCGVEIAPLQGQSRGLDWSGVLLILAIEKM